MSQERSSVGDLEASIELGEVWSLSVNALGEEPGWCKGCLGNRSETESTVLLTKSIT